MNQGFTHREVVGAAAAGATLLSHLAARWRGGGARDWRERLDRAEVLLAGAVATGAERLAAGDELIWRRPPWEEPPAPLGFAVLRLDPHLLAVAKPAGLPTMPSGGRFLEHTLLHRVRRRWPEAAPLHRLDRGTSGVVLFSRTSAARRAASLAWQRGEVRRLYRGLVHGSLGDGEIAIDAPIGELPHPELGRVFAACPQGRAARTVVRPLERRSGSTLVEIEIGSGRPHQIRIHLASIGHRLVGEPFFGDGGRPVEPGRARPGDCGYLLHAWRLELRHPADGSAVAVECPPPPPLRAAPGPPPAT